jgi:lysine 2,3-aminomutase
VASPARITSQLVDALAASGRSVVVAVHVNHPRELTPEARTALLRLADTGVHLLSQSVLLRGVNDDTDTLESLFRALVTARVKPYYLHHGDLAPGTSHFRVPLWRGQEIMAELRRRLSGIAIPAYVLDIPGGYGKVPVDGTHTRWLTDGVYEVIDAAGRTHRYADACS